MFSVSIEARQQTTELVELAGFHSFRGSQQIDYQRPRIPKREKCAVARGGGKSIAAGIAIAEVFFARGVLGVAAVKSVLGVARAIYSETRVGPQPAAWRRAR